MRSSGILMHISSLSSPYGIGTLGKEARDFIDFLEASGEAYWQILPVGPTGYGDSPYQSFSAFAGNPYFIDLDRLCEEGLLKKEEYSSVYWGKNPGEVDYSALYEGRNKVLSLAADRMEESSAYRQFLTKNAEWLPDYALYTVIKESLGGVALSEWEDRYRLKDSGTMEAFRKAHEAEISRILKIQFLFERQWEDMKSYAHEHHVRIIGDIPIYVSSDSADLFSSPEQFLLGKDKRPCEVAGCPPDAFSEKGQLWGNPLYDWSYAEQKGYDFWIRRLKRAKELFDVVRIDHFRGFESFYAIPFGAVDATKGRWRKGPGAGLFKALQKEIGDFPIIAEDLGTITPEVRKLLKTVGYPGMKVLQFAFAPGADSEYLPHHHIENCVIYTGTHDNDTIRGWLENADKEEYDYARRYMRLNSEEGEGWGVIRTALQSSARLCVIPMQDFINAGSEARMNTPSTLGGNWVWRIEGSCLNPWLARIIREQNLLYGRCEEKED